MQGRPAKPIMCEVCKALTAGLGFTTGLGDLAVDQTMGKDAHGERGPQYWQSPSGGPE